MFEARPDGSIPTLVESRSLVFEEHAVVKHQSVERTRLELMKTQLGAEIGRATGLFRTPDVLGQDPLAGSITFERLRGFCNLQQALSTSPAPDRLMQRVARSLAAIHDHLLLPDGYVTPFTGLGVGLSTRPVFIHGDFSTGNIFYSDERSDLVVMDWSIADWLADATLGPRYIDLTILLQSLFTRRPFGPDPIPDPPSLACVFLDTYWNACRGEMRADEFQRCFTALMAVFLRTCGKQKGWRFLAYQPSLLQAQHFVRRFCRELASAQ